MKEDGEVDVDKCNTDSTMVSANYCLFGRIMAHHSVEIGDLC